MIENRMAGHDASLSPGGSKKCRPGVRHTGSEISRLGSSVMVGLALIAGQVILRLASLVGRGGQVTCHDILFFGMAMLVVITVALTKVRPSMQNRRAVGALLIMAMLIESTPYLQFTGQKMWDDTLNVLDFSFSMGLLIVGIYILTRAKKEARRSRLFADNEQSTHMSH